jgi:hypothetical protein
MTFDELTEPRHIGEIKFTIDGDNLILTIGPESLNVCKHCPDLHVLILKNVSQDKLRDLILGLAHLWKHHNDN